MAEQRASVNRRRSVYFGAVLVAALGGWVWFYFIGGVQKLLEENAVDLLFWVPFPTYAIIGLGGTAFCLLSILCHSSKRRWHKAQEIPQNFDEWVTPRLARTSMCEWTALTRWEAAYFAVAFCAASAWASFNVYMILDTTPVTQFCSDEILCKLFSLRSRTTFLFAFTHVFGIFTLIFAAWTLVKEIATVMRSTRRKHSPSR